MNELFQQELRGQFLQKLIDNYEELYTQHGSLSIDLPGIQNVNGFVEDLCDLIEAELSEQIGTVDARKLTPSKDTFRRLLFGYEAGNRWQSKTRHALCLFLGYGSWEDFKEKNRDQIKKDVFTVSTNQLMLRPAWLPVQQVQYVFLNPPTKPGIRRLKRFSIKKAAFGMLALVILYGIGWWSWQWWITRPFSSEQLAGVRFRIERVEGKFLPQTLVLAYDVRSLGVDSITVDFSSTDQGYNQLPGDLDRIIKHSAQGRFLYPLWKPADCTIRLIARQHVVATLRHITQTDGWIGWTADPVSGLTQALPQNQIQAAGKLQVATFARKGAPGDYYSHLVYQHPFNLDADEVDWQVRLKNPLDEGGISCFDPWISVHWGGGGKQLIGMQTSRVGCGVSTFIQIGDRMLRNGEHDLSQLSTDFESWRTLRILTKNHEALFFVDDKLAFKEKYAANLSMIQSLHIAFKGSGSVDWVRLANARSGKVIYEADF